MSPLVRVHIIPDDNCKPRVRRRKRTNTLSVGLDRKHETSDRAANVRGCAAHVYTHSCPRTRRYADAIMLELIREVDTAIGILDEFLAIDLFCKSRQNKFRLRSEVLDPFRRQYHYIGPLDIYVHSSRVVQATGHALDERKRTRIEFRRGGWREGATDLQQARLRAAGGQIARPLSCILYSLQLCRTAVSRRFAQTPGMQRAHTATAATGRKRSGSIDEEAKVALLVLPTLSCTSRAPSAPLVGNVLSRVWYALINRERVNRFAKKKTRSMSITLWTHRACSQAGVRVHEHRVQAHRRPDEQRVWAHPAVRQVDSRVLATASDWDYAGRRYVHATAAAARSESMRFPIEWNAAVAERCLRSTISRAQEIDSAIRADNYISFVEDGNDADGSGSESDASVKIVSQVVSAIAQHAARPPCNQTRVSAPNLVQTLASTFDPAHQQQREEAQRVHHSKRERDMARMELRWVRSERIPAGKRKASDVFHSENDSDKENAEPTLGSPFVSSSPSSGSLFVSTSSAFASSPAPRKV
ncbi:hypothetical protein GGX14DRAFT_571568 [Mycena pura]|uniref:Uncharacterized protein n=1 Tax=Mycena pura TaxID=153505 RepID=A0AAD6V6A0_9AGAR|nr:hypothetical protein GGX14DRAFT_571568 [Mycena pura]